MLALTDLDSDTLAELHRLARANGWDEVRRDVEAVFENPEGTRP